MPRKKIIEQHFEELNKKILENLPKDEEEPEPKPPGRRGRGRPRVHHTEEERAEARKRDKNNEMIRAYKTRLYDNVTKLMIRGGWTPDRMIKYVEAIVRLGIDPRHRFDEDSEPEMADKN